MHGDALTTKENIKERLGITVENFDALIERMIVSATARIENLCGRRFIQATYVHEIHDGTDITGSRRTYLVLKNAPVQSISSIEYNSGSNTNPNWTALGGNEYNVDYDAGLLHCPYGLPTGFRNVRITYTGGFSGYTLGISNSWVFNAVPAGVVDGQNLAFSLPEAANQLVVYADGMRESAANIEFVEGSDTFSFVPERAPYSTIAVDYLKTEEQPATDNFIPADLVEVCEKAVVKAFKRRESEGKSSETFQESSITWEKSVFSEDDLATIRSYRRGYYV